MLLLFSFLSIHSTTLSSLYTLFDHPTTYMTHWLKQDRNSVAKDLFIFYNHLPNRYRKYSKNVALHTNKSVDGKFEYRSIVISIKRKTTISFLLGGVKHGKITINGRLRKEIKTTSPIDPVVFKATFIPGNYLLVITVKERFASDIDPILLSTKKIHRNTKASFTKNAKVTTSFSSIAPPQYHKLFTDWHLRHCFPRPFATKERKKGSEKQLLHTILLQDNYSEEHLALLKKTGFSTAMISWWHKEFITKGVCNVKIY